MKKNYFFALFASLMFFMALPATAQVSMMSDLFGKYKFTATITTTEAGAAHADKFKNECEVVITKSESQYFMADISGFAGADYSMNVSDFDERSNTFKVNGPNNANYGIWNGYIAVANTNGDWPFSLWNVEGSVQYALTFTFDPQTKEITVPDFTIVSLSWSPSETTTILATVSNVKMELLEAENVDTSSYPDLAGEWTWEGGLRNEDVSPKSFTLTLEANGDTKANWNATFAFEGYEAFTLPGTFDGSLLTVPFDSLFLDRENRIRFGVSSSSKQYSGAFTFMYASKTSMMLYEYIYVRRDSINPETNELAGAFVHQVFDGYVVRENPDAYDWTGTYKVKAEVDDIDANDGITFSKEFDMVIDMKPGNLFVITSMLGYSELSIPLTPSDDDKYATVELGGYSGAMLEFIGNVGEGESADYAYHVITDANAEPTSLKITRNDDGTFSFEDFTVSYKLYYANSYEPLALYVGAKAEKEVFDWAGEYTLTADVESLDGGTYKESFKVAIIIGNDGVYYISEFDGDKVYSLNYGGIPLAISANAKTASFQDGRLVGGSYPIYNIIKGVTSETIVMELNNDGSVSMDDFQLRAMDYASGETSPMANYTNVVLTRGFATGIENVLVENNVVNGVFDMQGRRIEAITAPGLYIVNGKKVLVK